MTKPPERNPGETEANFNKRQLKWLAENADEIYRAILKMQRPAWELYEKGLMG